jgi:hypothetical protein
MVNVKAHTRKLVDTGKWQMDMIDPYEHLELGNYPEWDKKTIDAYFLNMVHKGAQIMRGGGVFTITTFNKEDTKNVNILLKNLWRYLNYDEDGDIQLQKVYRR